MKPVEETRTAIDEEEITIPEELDQHLPLLKFDALACVTNPKFTKLLSLYVPPKYREVIKAIEMKFYLTQVQFCKHRVLFELRRLQHARLLVALEEAKKFGKPHPSLERDLIQLERDAHKKFGEVALWLSDITSNTRDEQLLARRPYFDEKYLRPVTPILDPSFESIRAEFFSCGFLIWHTIPFQVIQGERVLLTPDNRKMVTKDLIENFEVLLEKTCCLSNEAGRFATLSAKELENRVQFLFDSTTQPEAEIDFYDNSANLCSGLKEDLHKLSSDHEEQFLKWLDYKAECPNVLLSCLAELSRAREDDRPAKPIMFKEGLGLSDKISTDQFVAFLSKNAMSPEQEIKSKNEVHTLFGWAIVEKNLQAVNILMVCGANLFALDPMSKRTVLEFALEIGDREICTSILTTMYSQAESQVRYLSLSVSRMMLHHQSNLEEVPKILLPFYKGLLKHINSPLYRIGDFLLGNNKLTHGIRIFTGILEKFKESVSVLEFNPLLSFTAPHSRADNEFLLRESYFKCVRDLNAFLGAISIGDNLVEEFERDREEYVHFDSSHGDGAALNRSQHVSNRRNADRHIAAVEKEKGELRAENKQIRLEFEAYKRQADEAVRLANEALKIEEKRHAAELEAQKAEADAQQAIIEAQKTDKEKIASELQAEKVGRAAELERNATLAQQQQAEQERLREDFSKQTIQFQSILESQRTELGELRALFMMHISKTSGAEDPAKETAKPKDSDHESSRFSAKK